MIQQTSKDESSRECIQAAICLLDQGMGLLGLISDEAYNSHLAVASNASIGGHYRHCLDHFHCLLLGLETGLIDYDDRPRNLSVEMDRSKAMEESVRLKNALSVLSGEMISNPVGVRCKVHYEMDRSQEVSSTFAREIMYVVAHGVHHFALISVMANVMDFPLPSDFGVAPSTLQHRSFEADRASAVA
jgi:hypothetical protein